MARARSSKSPAPDPSAPTRERLATAAFSSFAEHGFDATTVDDIAEAAGVSRRTFFRQFATKEDAIFPDHDRLQANVAEQLEVRRHQPPLVAVCEAVKVVMADYVRQRETSVQRFALTRVVPALREREVTSVHTYQRMFVRYLRERLGRGHDLDAELMAATVVAAHNATLRTWLSNGGRRNAFADLDKAFARVQRLFPGASSADTAPGKGDAGRARTTVVVIGADLPADDVARRVSDVLGEAARARPKDD